MTFADCVGNGMLLNPAIIIWYLNQFGHVLHISVNTSIGKVNMCCVRLYLESVYKVLASSFDYANASYKSSLLIKNFSEYFIFIQ